MSWLGSRRRRDFFPYGQHTCLGGFAGIGGEAQRWLIWVEDGHASFQMGSGDSATRLH